MRGDPGLAGCRRLFLTRDIARLGLSNLVIGCDRHADAAHLRSVGKLDIGNGRELFLDCEGSGSPTVLLEAGDQDTGLEAWRFVMPRLIGQSQTCTYARAGLGASSPASGCRQLGDLVNDLDALLESAGIGGPYVLVGASGGGFIMAGFAARHPRQVAGMVFVETPKALTAKLYPDVVPQIRCNAAGNVERRDYLAVEHAAWDHRKQLGDIPLTIMTNDYGASVDPTLDEATNVRGSAWLVRPDLAAGPPGDRDDRSQHRAGPTGPRRPGDHRRPRSRPLAITGSRTEPAAEPATAQWNLTDPPGRPPWPQAPRPAARPARAHGPPARARRPGRSPP